MPVVVRWVAVGAIALVAAACTRHNPAYRGAVPGPDASDDGRGPAAADRVSGDSPLPPTACGMGTATVDTISGADGVEIDDDGTLYFLTDDSTHSYVGRILPGAAPVTKWLRIDNSPVTWGLALDRTRKRLYVAVVSGAGAIVRFDNITGTPTTGRTVATPVSNPNDVVVAEDGTAYYSNQGDRNIYSVSVDGQGPTLVTTSPLGSVAAGQAPAGLAIAPDGALIVGLEDGGRLYRLTLGGGKEVSRDYYGTWTGWANGLTFDRHGRLYIGIYDDTEAKSVVRLETNGTVTTLLTGGRYSNLTFGRGALDCRDLYITEPFGPMHRLRVDDAN